MNYTRKIITALFVIFAAQLSMAYTEITVRCESHQQINGGDWSILGTDWRRYDDSDSEATVLYDKSSIYYKNIPKEYEPLVGTTNVTVNRDQSTWEVFSTKKTIYETYKTGWILVESGKINNNWYKVFSITNGQYTYESLQYYNGAPSVFTFHNLDVWIVTIIKSSGMPKNPYWLADADDGPDSKVLTASPYPVKYSWMRRHYPAASTLNFEAIAMTTGENGMKVYESALLKKNPTDPNSKLVCQLLFIDGMYRPFISIQQDFEQYGFAAKVACKKNLADKDWVYASTWEECEEYNFFKAVVTQEGE